MVSIQNLQSTPITINLTTRNFVIQPLAFQTISDSEYDQNKVYLQTLVAEFLIRMTSDTNPLNTINPKLQVTNPAQLTKFYIDDILPGPGITNVIYVRVGGDDENGTGSFFSPYASPERAEEDIIDAVVPGPYGGLIQNPNKSYTIDVGPGSFLTDPSYAPNPYVNYRGAGRDLTFIAHNDFSAIIMNYGDNYGSYTVYADIHFFKFHILRNPGFTDMSQTGNYNGGFNFATFAFYNCTTNRMSCQGSGFDQGFDWATGGPNIVVDQFIFNGGFVGGNFQGCQFQTYAGCQLGNVELGYNGIDQQYSLSLAQTCQINNSFGGNITLDSYAVLYVSDSPLGFVTINGRVDDPAFTAIFGPAPALNVDPVSLPFPAYDGAIQLNGDAQLDQVSYLANYNTPDTQDQAVSGTPYVNVAGFKRIISTGGPGIDITLKGGGFDHVFPQTVVEGANDSNPIIIRAPQDADGHRRWKFPGNLDFVTKTGAYQHWDFFFTNIGHVNGTNPQTDQVVLAADVSGDLNNTWYLNWGVTFPPVFGNLPFVTWYNVDGAGVAPTNVPEGSYLTEVKLISNSSQGEVVYRTLKYSYPVFDNHTGRGPNSFMNLSSDGANVITRITARADNNGDLNGTWFKFYSPFDREQYVVFFHVNGMDVLQPNVPGTTQYFQADINMNDDAQTVSLAWGNPVDASIPFLQYNPLPPYTIPDAASTFFFGAPGNDFSILQIIAFFPGSGSPAQDGDIPTGFTFNVDQAGVDATYIQYQNDTYASVTGPSDGTPATGFAFSTPIPGVDDVRGFIVSNP